MKIDAANFFVFDEDLRPLEVSRGDGHIYVGEEARLVFRVITSCRPTLDQDRLDTRTSKCSKRFHDQVFAVAFAKQVEAIFVGDPIGLAHAQKSSRFILLLSILHLAYPIRELKARSCFSDYLDLEPKGDFAPPATGFGAQMPLPLQFVVLGQPAFGTLPHELGWLHPHDEAANAL